jgi:hypothetical protein
MDRGEGMPDGLDDNEERRRWDEELAADPDYVRWVEASYELHQQEQG